MKATLICGLIALWCVPAVAAPVRRPITETDLVAVTQQIDLKIYPTVKRIFETAMALPEFAKAHPLVQPDTPEAMRAKR